MSSDAKPEGPLKGIVGSPKGEGMRIGIAAGRFHGRVTQLLVDGALAQLESAGVKSEDVSLAWVPGAFELPLLAQAMADAGADAVICLGVVIRGETSHYDFVAGECAAGIQRVGLDADIPVIFGVLTTDNLEQALARAGGEHGHKGVEAAEAALEMIDVLRQVSRVAAASAEESSAGPRLYKA